MTGTKLFIGNLPDNCDKDELEAMFRKFGNVVEFDVLKDYGFVHFEVESEAQSAVDAMDGQIHKGRNIRVEVSRSRVRQKAGMGGKGECYRCGAEGHWSKECPKGPTRPRGGDRGDRGDRGRGRSSGRYDPYARDPYYPPSPDPYDYYRARFAAYDRYRMDYERRLGLPPLPRDPLYRDFEARGGGDDPYRRSPPRDPYYDFYERRRLAAMDPYEDRMGASSRAAASTSYPLENIQKELPPNRQPLKARVPGPY